MRADAIRPLFNHNQKSREHCVLGTFVRFKLFYAVNGLIVVINIIFHNFAGFRIYGAVIFPAALAKFYFINRIAVVVFKTRLCKCYARCGQTCLVERRSLCSAQSDKIGGNGLCFAPGGICGFSVGSFVGANTNIILLSLVSPVTVFKEALFTLTDFLFVKLLSVAY